MKRWLGRIAQIGATAGATLVNPALGVAVGSAFAGGEGGKQIGKKIAAATGRRMHKATGPAGALLAPALIAPVANVLGVDMAGLCQVVQDLIAQICSSPAGAGTLVSILAILGHGASRNSTRPAAN